MKLTQEGQAVFEAIQNSSVVVDAVAGAGKSTLAGYICSNTPERIQYIVYTRANKDAMSSRVGRNTTVQTINAYGKRILDAQLNTQTIPDADAHLESMTSVGIAPNYVLQQIWNCLRLENPLLGPDSTEQEWGDAFDSMGIEDLQAAQFSDPSNLLKLSKECIRRIQAYGVTDFVDHLWAPLHLEGLDDIKVPSYLILDEANDASPATVELIRRTAGGRVLAIGDRFQTIFEFAGAYLGNMDDIVANHGAVELPLTNCWRCSPEIITFVQNWYVPHIRTENSHSGSVTVVPHITPEAISKADLVVSARYSGLLPHLFAALTSGTPCFLEGRDFISGVLKEFSNKRGTKGQNTSDVEWFEDRARFFTACARKLRPTAGNASRIQMLLDKADSFSVFSSSGLSMAELSKLLRAAVDGKKAARAIRFSSIHRAKGLEAEATVVVGSTSTEGWEACSAGDLQNETLRLMYVACTRAKTHLLVQSTPLD